MKPPYENRTTAPSETRYDPQRPKVPLSPPASPAPGKQPSK